jgi:prepilin-type processing-associated H-X9-DG protein
MQFSLQSLLLSFVVVCSAMGAFGPGGIFVAIIMLAIAAYIRTAPSMWKAAMYVMLWLCVLLFLLALLLPAMSCAREAARRGACANNLKQLVLALQNYHDMHGSFPLARTSDADGKPMHSWRTSLLPFLECQSVYDKCNFKEPWDSENNRKLGVRFRLFQCPSSLFQYAGSTQPTFTNYVAVVGPNTAWPGERSLKLSDIPDSGRHTIMLVELADSDIPWMEPRDVTIEEAIRAIRSGQHVVWNGYFYHDQTGANAAFVDGSVRFLPADTPTETLETLLTINDGKSLPNISSLGVFPEPPLHWEHITALLVLAGSYALLLFRPRRRNVPAGQTALGAGQPTPPDFSGKDSPEGRKPLDE